MSMQYLLRIRERCIWRHLVIVRHRLCHSRHRRLLTVRAMRMAMV